MGTPRETPNSRGPKEDPNQEPQRGPHLANWGPQLGTPVRDPKQGPHKWTSIRYHKRSLILDRKGAPMRDAKGDAKRSQGSQGGTTIAVLKIRISLSVFAS